MLKSRRLKKAIERKTMKRKTMKINGGTVPLLSIVGNLDRLKEYFKSIKGHKKRTQKLSECFCVSL